MTAWSGLPVGGVLLNEGFGDEEISWGDDEQIIGSFTKWLHKMANVYLEPRDERHDDLVQEGRIAMWSALPKWEASKGTLAPWLTTAAKMRMKDFAYGHGQPTGREPTRGSREVEAVVSVDALVEAGVESVVGISMALEGVEVAYHEGEIQKALEALPEAQRKYVFARFWAGLDPMSRAPEMVALVATVPELRKRRLWSGDNSMVGARERLREALAHLETV